MNLNKNDVANASKQIGLTDSQIDHLWHALQGVQPKSGLLSALLYFGAVVAFLSMTWFYAFNFKSSIVLCFSTLYALLFFGTGAYFWHTKKLKLPGGLLTSLGIVMVPIIVYSVQSVMQWWPAESPIQYSGFYRWIRGEWVPMELCTISVACLTLYFIRFPFISFLIYGFLSFLSLDAIRLLDSSKIDQWFCFCAALITIGLILNVLAFTLSKRNQTDFEFWSYLAGMFLLWSGLTGLEIQTEWGYSLYFLINFLFILLSNFFHRKIFMFFGFLGITYYIGHLAYRFSDVPMFSYILAAIGFAIVALSAFIMHVKPVKDGS